MSELTLESLAKRVEELERAFAAHQGVVPPTRTWQSVVGISQESEFSDLWKAEMDAAREAERRAAREGAGE